MRDRRSRGYINYGPFPKRELYMKGKKSRGFINYGSIPKNEYTTTDTSMSADAEADLEFVPKPDNTTYNQRMKKLRMRRVSDPRSDSGWARPSKINGWRSVSAALQDELIHLKEVF